MKKKLILFCSICLFLISNIDAKINNNYNSSADYANKYIEKFNDNSKYIIKSDKSFIVPFSYENGTLSTNNLYKNGGMLSLTEFKYTLINNNSYLLSGQEYWTLTSKKDNYNYVITHIKENYKDISSDSGLKVTEQVKEDTKVYGNGTYNNPWIFIPKYNVIVKNTTPDYGNVSTKSNFVYAGDSAKITLEPKAGYGYDSDTCSDMSGYSRNENNVIISNIRKDITCSFTFASKIFNVEFDSNGGSICNPNSYSYQMGDAYNLDCTPIRNGFDFDGWYTELDAGTKLTTSTKITNYDDHSIYAHWLAKSINLTNQNFQAYYSSNQINFNIAGATGGSGVYTYTITGTGADNFSISANTLYVAAGTNIGTYTLTVTAEDDYSESTASAVFVVTIKQQTTTTREITTGNKVTTDRTTTPKPVTPEPTPPKPTPPKPTPPKSTTPKSTTPKSTTPKSTTPKPVSCTSIRSSSVCESTPGCIWRQQACYVNGLISTTPHTTTTTKKPTSCGSIKNSTDCRNSGCIWRQGACYVGGSTTTKKATTTTKKTTKATTKATTKKTTKATTKKTTKKTTKSTTRKTTKKTTKRTSRRRVAPRTMSLAAQCTCTSGSNCFGGYVCTGNSCCSQ